MKLKMKSIICTLTAVAVLVSITCPVLAQPLEKNETVYIKLDSNGKPASIDVVNWLNAEGKSSVEDETSLKDIKSIPDGLKLSRENGKVSIDLKDYKNSSIFYTGVTDKDLPVQVDISYFLDGKKIDAKELAGQKGDIEIIIKLHNDTGANDSLNFLNFVTGSTSKFDKTTYTPFLAQVGVDLPLNSFDRIDAPDAVKIVVGKVMKLNWMIFPYPDGEVSVRMHTENFELDPISVNILPQMPPVPDIELESKLVEMHDGVKEMGSKLNLMIDGTKSIHEGSSKLESAFMEYARGFDRIKTGSQQLSKGTPALASGIRQMIVSTQKLGQAQTAQIKMTEEISGINGEIVKAVQAIGRTPGMENTSKELIEALYKQKYMLDTLQNGGKLPDGTDFPGLTITENGLKQLQEGMVNYEEGFGKLEKGLLELNSGIEKLSGYTGNLKDGTSKVSSGIGKVGNGLEEFKTLGLSELEDGIAEQVNEARKGEELKNHLEQRVANYSGFTGNCKGLSNVEFLMQTDAIKVSEAESFKTDEDKAEAGKDDSGVWNKIADFFKRLFGVN